MKEKNQVETTPQDTQAKRIVINVERYQHLLEALHKSPMAVL